MSVGQNIKKLREALGWSGVKLARLADISTQLLSALEVRGSNKSAALPKIAAAIGVPVEVLTGDYSTEEMLAMRERQRRVVDFLDPADRALLEDMATLLPEDREKFRSDVRALAEKARKYREQPEKKRPPVLSRAAKRDKIAQ